MIVIPAIDLRNGRCVRLTQGQAANEKIYDADPISVARSFAEAGAQFIHVVDLDGAFSGRKSLNRQIVEKMIDEVATTIQFGGGIRTIEDVRELSDRGVQRIILGTLATESSELVGTLVEEFADTILVAVDARDGRVSAEGWTRDTQTPAFEFAAQLAALGVSRIVYTDISRDGTLTGPNIEAAVKVAQVSQISVTASGGVSSLKDIELLRDCGEPLVDSVIIGKALYEGRFTIKEALRVANSND